MGDRTFKSCVNFGGGRDDFLFPFAPKSGDLFKQAQ